MADGTCPIVEHGVICGAPARGAHGLCNRHRLRLQRKGDPLALHHRSPDESYADWFWTKVAPADANGCREWMMYRTPQGYGRLGGPNGRLVAAHRIAWELTYGSIPDGLFVCHYPCNNPPCCEPTHLRLGTHDHNSRDMVLQGRGRNRYGKIPDAVKDEVRRRLATGEQGKSIAADLGISQTSVSQIKQRRVKRR